MSSEMQWNHEKYGWKQHELCRPQQISDELCWQKLGKNIKAKILTAQYQAVRILYGAPERHIFVISIEIFWISETTDYQINTQLYYFTQ